MPYIYSASPPLPISRPITKPSMCFSDVVNHFYDHWIINKFSAVEPDG
jgi:hypothetical protein